MSRIGIVTALPGEARTLSRRVHNGRPYELGPGFTIMISGIGAERATAAAQQLLNTNVEALISWGTAAGLDPALPAGSLLLPESILSGGLPLPVHAAWHRQAIERLRSLDVSSRPLAESPALLATAAAKLRLRQETGAVAADMESAAIARLARNRGVPFLCIRAVVDAAEETVPAALPSLLDDFGRIRYPVLLQTLLRQPGLLGDLFRLQRRFSRASRCLKSVARDMAALELPQS